MGVDDSTESDLTAQPPATCKILLFGTGIPYTEVTTIFFGSTARASD